MTTDIEKGDQENTCVICLQPDDLIHFCKCEVWIHRKCAVQYVTFVRLTDPLCPACREPLYFETRDKDVSMKLIYKIEFALIFLLYMFVLGGSIYVAYLAIPMVDIPSTPAWINWGIYIIGILNLAFTMPFFFMLLILSFMFCISPEGRRTGCAYVSPAGSEDCCCCCGNDGCGGCSGCGCGDCGSCDCGSCGGGGEELIFICLFCLCIAVFVFILGVSAMVVMSLQKWHYALRLKSKKEFVFYRGKPKPEPTKTKKEVKSHANSRARSEDSWHHEPECSPMMGRRYPGYHAKSYRMRDIDTIRSQPKISILQSTSCK